MARRIFTKALALFAVSCVLTYMSAPLFAATAAPFEILRSNVHEITSSLDRTYEIFVQTPPGYDPTADRRYPVVYLTDGAYAFPVAASVSRLPFFFDEFAPVIFVGLSAAKGEKLLSSRQRDLTPYAPPGWKTPGGGAADYLSFIEQTVFPFIEGEYRADPERRTLVGQSYGGLFGAWALLARPGLFESYILTSPSLWVMRHQIFTDENETPVASPPHRARVYMAVGGRETNPTPGPRGTSMIADQTFFAERLRQREGLVVKDDIIENATHGTTFPTGFINGMAWLYGEGR